MNLLLLFLYGRSVDGLVDRRGAVFRVIWVFVLSISITFLVDVTFVANIIARILFDDNGLLAWDLCLQDRACDPGWLPGEFLVYVGMNFVLIRFLIRKNSGKFFE